jgi:hypothetical protein
MKDVRKGGGQKPKKKSDEFASSATHVGYV